MIVLGLSFFFFQAEDGIRDLTVTGVQTCALPISCSTYSCQLFSISSLKSCTSVPSRRPCCRFSGWYTTRSRSEEHTSELQSQSNLVCRLLLEKKKKKNEQLSVVLSKYRCA